MASYLVIVESPAKAKTIGKFLGKNYKVIASVGHVRDLPKSKMGVDVDNNFEPHYITIRGKGEIIKELKKQAKKADKIFLATDPDREGEAIAWHLKSVLANSNDKFERVAFNAITKDAVRTAIKNGRDINMDLVDAQQARRILDRLVGYSISPILWRKIRRGLSAGRVQSVATRIICQREREIKAFVSEEYWTLDAEFKKNKDTFKANFYGKNGKKIALANKDAVDAILAGLNEEYKIVEIKKAKRQRKPPAPFITSSLQQEAASRYGFTTKKTMINAQQLYEGIKISGRTIGLITYMRTDSTRIAPEATKSIESYIQTNYGENYLGKLSKGKVAKGMQDAHEAIRPTDVDLVPAEIEKYLTKDQFKLYKLIWERSVASHMAIAEYEQLKLLLKNGDYEFKAQGSKLVFDGFLRLYSYAVTNDVILPELTEGEIVDLKKLLPNQHFTQAPPRYTEATLVKAMEELGIGRPSTYAPTISTILARGYVGKEKKALYPTELGVLVNDIMESYFDDVIDVTFTAGLEKSLDGIEEDKTEWRTVIRDFYQDFKLDLDKAEEELERISLDEETDEICDKCGAKMVIKHGRFGKFIACSNYPDCQNTKALLNRIGVTCPKCNVGDIVERKTKKYKSFYGCSAFPDCRFISWHKPTGELCPQCKEPLIDYRTKKKQEIRCSNKECSYKVEKKQ